ncbi:MAG: DUF559 domain-containing protein [Pedobacter sp.]|nr:MAG: DUF559 domain-containing protein [Pedobacter sp.]
MKKSPNVDASLLMESVNLLQPLFELIENHKLDVAGFFTEEISQVCQSFLLEGREFPEFLRPQLLEQQPSPSQQQIQLGKFLEQKVSGCTVETEALVDAWFVDLLMKHEGRELVIELDGPHHYIDGKLRSQDQRRDDWLQFKVFKIIRLRNATNEILCSQILSQLKQLFPSIPDDTQPLPTFRKGEDKDDNRSSMPPSAFEEMQSKEPAFQEVSYSKRNKKSAREKKGLKY